MKAGRLPFKIQILCRLSGKNPTGDPKTEWTHRGYVQGSIDGVRGEERYAALQEKAAADTTITIRGNAAPYLTTKMRMVHRDRVFDIESIIDMNGRGIKKTILCKEAA